MTAFDTDVLTEILLGNVAYVQRASTIPANEQAVPSIVVEEILRGRLHQIRQAEAGKSKISVVQAYQLFEQLLGDLPQWANLPYTAQADSLFQEWRKQKLRVGTHDLRIAALCVTHTATLASRNRRDFELVPGLTVEFWE